MEQINKLVVIVASLMIMKPIVTGTKNETKLLIDRRHYHMPLFINICDIEDRRSKVHCYCDNNKPNMAKRADCWVFSGGISEDDPIWPSFSSQPEIEHLMFNVRSDDALYFIPAKAVVRLDKLKYISIQFGTINRVSSYAFTNSSSLKQIVLKSNKITELDRHAFAQMMMLSNLSLDDNQISELRRDVFYGLPNLHVLHLSNNNLTILHEGCFKHLNSLVELKLDYNYISVVTREMFEGLENLSRLNLRNNKLAMLGNLAFSESWGLKELLLDNNAIEYISERAFGGLTQLKKLTLAGNKISSFYEDILEDMTHLVLFDLRNNQLQTITYDSIRIVVENDKTYSAIYLDGNPLACDCRLSWVYVLRNETKDDTLRQALHQITCELETAEQASEDEDANMENILADNYEYDDKSDTGKSGRDKSVRLVDIPLAMLPCPKELLQDIEESYGQPVQNEIRLKAYSSVSRIHISIVLILPLLWV